MWSKKRLLLILLPVTMLLFGRGDCFCQPIGIMSPKAQNITEYTPLSCPGGRFVFGQVSDSSKDQYMLDTWTGRLWRLSESGEVGKYLSPVPYKLRDGNYGPIPEDVGQDHKGKGQRASKGE
ncbi:MAG: hypothetical protein DRH12_03750 [Deltaproteobacteria bacterium]|nr:MAG: hypothetical protein DRH12_03750 [Deltaproteobacteria bacterium]